MKPETVVWRFVSAFVDELARCGVQHACICPGSRSTPLAMLLDRHPDIKIWVHLDERAAAFFALGMARARRQPVALVCTSGTAAANFLPAVVEAHYARVPLVVLTADRPPELRDVGANQTIDQMNLYGRHVKWFTDAGLPEGADQAVLYIRTVADRAVSRALATPAGAVHLNLPFREPLVPLPDQDKPETSSPGSRADRRPYTAVARGTLGPDGAQLERLAAQLSACPRGLIVCGPQDDPSLAGALVRLAGVLGYPILADPLSQVRCGKHNRSLVVDAYDAFLRDERCVQQLQPDVVLRFGAMPRSKPVLLYLQRHYACRHIVVDAGGGWSDPTLRASDMVYADPRTLCDGLVSALGERPGAPTVPATTWQASWLETNRATCQAMAQYLSAVDELFEGKVLAELAGLLPDGSTLFAGNSMPVRDLETFFHGSDRSIRFLANHGASGIDGVISSALGARTAVSDPLVLVIGDLSFYHDLNGLLASRLHHLDATVVLLNNDGGGIFSFLPQAAYPEQFETLFGTPHGLDFRGAVEMYGGRFERVDSWAAFRNALERAGTMARPCGRGLHVIEVPTERARNVALHREVWAAVGAALERKAMRSRPYELQGTR